MYRCKRNQFPQLCMFKPWTAILYYLCSRNVWFDVQTETLRVSATSIVHLRSHHASMGEAVLPMLDIRWGQQNRSILWGPWDRQRVRVRMIFRQRTCYFPYYYPYKNAHYFAHADIVPFSPYHQIFHPLLNDIMILSKTLYSFINFSLSEHRGLSECKRLLPST